MSLLFTLQEKIAKEGGLSEWDAREDCHEDAPQRAGRLFLMHYGQASAGEGGAGVVAGGGRRNPLLHSPRPGSGTFGNTTRGYPFGTPPL